MLNPFHISFPLSKIHFNVKLLFQYQGSPYIGRVFRYIIEQDIWSKTKMEVTMISETVLS